MQIRPRRSKHVAQIFEDHISLSRCIPPTPIKSGYAEFQDAHLRSARKPSDDDPSRRIKFNIIINPPHPVISSPRKIRLPCFISRQNHIACSNSAAAASSTRWDARLLGLSFAQHDQLLNASSSLSLLLARSWRALPEHNTTTELPISLTRPPSHPSTRPP